MSKDIPQSVHPFQFSQGQQSQMYCHLLAFLPQGFFLKSWKSHSRCKSINNQEYNPQKMYRSFYVNRLALSSLARQFKYSIRFFMFTSRIKSQLFSATTCTILYQLLAFLPFLLSTLSLLFPGIISQINYLHRVKVCFHENAI